jgi:hypothetical protein
MVVGVQVGTEMLSYASTRATCCCGRSAGPGAGGVVDRCTVVYRWWVVYGTAG